MVEATSQVSVLLFFSVQHPPLNKPWWHSTSALAVGNSLASELARGRSVTRGSGDNPFMAGCQFQFRGGGFLKGKRMVERGMELSLFYRVRPPRLHHRKLHFQKHSVGVPRNILELNLKLPSSSASSLSSASASAQHGVTSAADALHKLELSFHAMPEAKGAALKAAQTALGDFASSRRRDTHFFLCVFVWRGGLFCLHAAIG